MPSGQRVEFHAHVIVKCILVENPETHSPDPRLVESPLVGASEDASVVEVGEAPHGPLPEVDDESAHQVLLGSPPGALCQRHELMPRRRPSSVLVALVRHAGLFQ